MKFRASIPITYICYCPSCGGFLREYRHGAETFFYCIEPGCRQYERFFTEPKFVMEAEIAKYEDPDFFANIRKNTDAINERRDEND